MISPALALCTTGVTEKCHKHLPHGDLETFPSQDRVNESDYVLLRQLFLFIRAGLQDRFE